MSGKQEGLGKKVEDPNHNLNNKADYKNQAHIIDGLRQNNPLQYTEQNHLQAQQFVSEMNKRLWKKADQKIVNTLEKWNEAKAKSSTIKEKKVYNHLPGEI